MADYTFDGRWLRNSKGLKLGEVDRNLIRGVNAAKLGEIEGKNFRDSRGKKVAEFDGKTIKDDRGKALITMKDLQAVVEGGSGIEMAAAWYFLVKTASTSSSTMR